MKQGWEIKKLGEVANVGAGNSAPQNKELFENGNFPFFRTSDVGQIRKGLIETSVDYLNEKGIKGLKLFQKGTILFPKSGASTFLNHRVMMNVNGYVSSHLATIKAKSKITDDRFLLYYLITIDAKDLMHYIAYPSLKTSDIGLIPIPLPPLPEQQRIVSILDKAFAAIDKAKANAEQNLRNARELFESYLQGVFENKGEGWEEKTLGQVCEFRNGQAHEQHIDENGKFILVNSKFISTDGEKGKRTNSALSPLYTDDIVFVMSDVPNGKALAKCFIIDKDNAYTLNQRICAIRSKFFDTRFLYYHLNRHKYLLSFNNGENQTNLRKNDILNCPLFLPSLKEQQTIIRKLDALSSETKKLEDIYQKKINELEEIKKSILQKAFSGEL